MRRQLKPLVQIRHEHHHPKKDSRRGSQEASSDMSHSHTQESVIEPSYARSKNDSCSRMRKAEITAAPQHCFVKLVQSPVTEDKFVLRFASASTAFEVEVKLNETVEIDWHEKSRNSERTPSPFSREEMNKMKRLFQSGKPEEIENQTEKSQKGGRLIRLQRIPTRDLSNIGVIPF